MITETASATILSKEEVPISTLEKFITLTAVVLPFAACITLAVMLFVWDFSAVEKWAAFGSFAVMYFLSILGVTLGFHRLFTHKSFETYQWMKVLLAIGGSMSLEGPLLVWCARHGEHHTYSDKPGDPHSPHLHGRGWKEFFKGLWHAHTGWLFKIGVPDLSRYVGHIKKNRDLVWASKTFPIWAAVSVLVPPLMVWAITATWQGLLLGLLANLARICVVHHVTWSINSVCHIWGTREFPTNDKSRNNPIFGTIGFGEGWHNNHHAFLRSARHGLRWWQFDLTYSIIWLMKKCGLVWNVVLPTPKEMERARERSCA